MKQKKLKKFVMQVPKCGVEPAGWKVTFYNGGSGNQEPEITGTTYAWTFNDITTDGINAIDAGGENTGKWVLEADYKYNSTPAGLALTMGKGDASQGFIYNKIDPAMAIGSNQSVVKEKGASVGAVEPAGELLTIKNVKGPFKVLAYVSGNSSSDKTDRYAYIKIGDEEVCAPTKSSNTVPAAGQELSYSYTGTDKVTVVIGCAKYLRVYDIKITSSAEQDQSDGTTVTFTPQSDNSTANTVDTLGLVGATVASADESIATATIANGKISVTSVAEGNTTITVTDANSKTASFKAIVSETGALTIGTITKFTRSAPEATVTAKASSGTAADGAGTVTWDGLTDLEWSIDGTNWATVAEVKTQITTFDVAIAGTTATVTGLPVGTYYVRGKASDAYEATESTTVTVGNSAAAKTTGSFDLLSSDLLGIGSAKIQTNDKINFSATSGDLTLTVAPTEVGTSVGTLAVQYVEGKGTLIKRDAMKLGKIKGSVKMTIKWYMNSKKSAGDRNLEVTVGATGTTVSVPTTDTTSAAADMADYVLDIEGGTDGVDVYIGASNELYIKAITIE